MDIRNWERSTLLAAVSAAAVLALTGCGPSSEADAPAESSQDELVSSTEPSAEPTTAEPSATPQATAPPTSPQAGDSEPGKDANDPALCDAANLAGSVEDLPGGAAAGSVYRGLVLTNTSDQGCVLKGFPGVSFVDSEGNQIGAAAARDTSRAPVSIDLEPGDSAMATLKQTNAQNYGEQCGLTEAAGLRVYPPGAYDSLIAEQDIKACSSDEIELMTIQAFQPQG